MQVLECADVQIESRFVVTNEIYFEKKMNIVLIVSKKYTVTLLKEILQTIYINEILSKNNSRLLRSMKTNSNIQGWIYHL